MRHKIKVWGRTHPWFGLDYNTTLWYVMCECGWEVDTDHEYPSGRSFYGRPSWHRAFALGVAHQKDAKEVCDCE